ncbi:MAG: hypothetical protein H0V82_09075 [Candidatus Protochlamydia sp.]|nr:hypothetical protein [Candidatus Protochlamydia sp.]
MGSISNLQIAGNAISLLIVNVSGTCLGITFYSKLNAIFEYALGKYYGSEYGKDLNNNIFVYVPYRDALWKQIIVRSISSLSMYKITTLAAGLLANKKIPFHSFYSFEDYAFMFTVGSSLAPFLTWNRGIRYYRCSGVYLSPEECQNRNINPRQIRQIREAVNIHNKESLWSLVSTPTLVPGRFDPLTNYEV